MCSAGLTVLYALFVWWFSTGAILYLNSLPTRTFGRSLIGANAVLGVSITVLTASSTQETATGAMIAFTSAVLIWGWHEMTFFMGVLTGPRPAPLTEGATGWRRFVEALGACIYHELAVAATAALIAGLSWNSSNRFGLWVFLGLWAMRLSAKFNIFLGVRNLNEQFVPDHLQFLVSYFRRRRINALFPVSVTAGTIACVLLIQRAAAAPSGGFEETGWTLVASLMVLAVLEHWFLVLPIRADALWQWAVGRPRPQQSSSDRLTGHQPPGSPGHADERPTALSGPFGAGQTGTEREPAVIFEAPAAAHHRLAPAFATGLAASTTGRRS